jgi:hypothetical protein
MDRIPPRVVDASIGRLGTELELHSSKKVTLKPSR